MDPLYYQTPDLSPYSFVANNPINLYDVAGLSEDDVAHPGLSLYYNVYYEDWFEDFNDVWDNLYSPEIGGSIAFSFFPGSGGNFLATYPSAKRIREKWKKRTFTGYYNTSTGDPVDADKIDLINEEWGEWEEYEYEAWVKIYEEVDGIGIGVPFVFRDFNGNFIESPGGRAIFAGFKHIKQGGWRYAQPYTDCASWLAKCFRDADYPIVKGYDFWTYNIVNNKNFIEVLTPRYGDIILWYGYKNNKYSGHVAFYLGQNLILHNSATLQKLYGRGTGLSNDYVTGYFNNNFNKNKKRYFRH